MHFIRRDVPMGCFLIKIRSFILYQDSIHPPFFQYFTYQYTGEQNKKRKRCLEYFTWFRSIRGHRYLNKEPFFPIGSSFPAIFGFWGNFLGSQEFLKNSLLTFYCTQNECLNAMVSMQNWFIKRATPGQDMWEKIKWGCGLVLCAMFEIFFTNISACGGLFFKQIFSLKRSFWVP